MLSSHRFLAGVEGLEPPTPGFGDRCSSQLSYTPIACSRSTASPFSLAITIASAAVLLERVKGIEPSSSAWKAVALPLSYTRLIRLLIRSSSAKASEDTLRLHTHRGAPPEAAEPRRVVEEVGFEPT